MGIEFYLEDGRGINLDHWIVNTDSTLHYFRYDGTYLDLKVFYNGRYIVWEITSEISDVFQQGISKGKFEAILDAQDAADILLGRDKDEDEGGLT